jgi:hypothetical protein
MASQVDITQKFLCHNITREEKYTTWLGREEERKREEEKKETHTLLIACL